MGFNGTNIDEAARATPTERGGELRVTTAPLNTLGDYRYSVIFAQYNGQWLFCRHKDRQIWETPGGHIEQGETPLEAAKRELFEETGAVDFEIYPAFDYKGTDAETSATGQVFFAEVKTLGVIPPDSEIGEVRLFGAPPANWTYPQMQSGLFDKMEKWLGLGDKDDEFWDGYDENRRLTGRRHKRGEPMSHGEFHLVVCVWVINGNGEILITRRSLRKVGAPGVWERTCGSAVVGETSLDAAIRECREEAGITLKRENGELFLTFRDDNGNSIYDSYLFRQDYDLAGVVLQEGETMDAKKARFVDIEGMMRRGEFIKCHDFGALKELLQGEKV